MMNSNRKTTALKPAKKGTAPIKVGTKVSKVVFPREKRGRERT